jgi:hypothetical protein
MSATSIASLIPQVAGFFSGAPHPVIHSMFIHAARELCRRSECWNEWQDVSIQPGIQDYELDTPVSDASVRNIRAVVIQPRKPMTPITNDEIIRNRSYLLSAEGEPTNYVINSDMSVRLYPKPTVNQTGLVASVRVSFIPNTDASTIPSELIDRFEECLVHGCKARMYELPDMPWSNDNKAMYHKQEFKNKVAEAEIELMTDYGAGDLVVQKRRFA